MHRRAFALSLAAALAACGKPQAPKPSASAAPTPAPTPSDLPPIADALALRNALEPVRLAAGMPALAACIVRPDGEIIAAAGLREVRGSQAVQLDDPWHIGSDTKAMTAALYAKLVEAGRLKWGATLPQLFPDLKLDAAWTGTTIEQVMSHTAGLGDIGVPWIIARRTDRRPLPEQRLGTVRDALSKPPPGKPGQFSYSNLDYVVVGAAIERATGQSWEDAIAQLVFRPLGMAHAGFGPPLGAAPRGHRTDLTGRLVAMGVGPEADNPPALGPAGTVHLPMSDWARFIRVFIDPKATFLSADSLRRLETIAPGTTYALGWGAGATPRFGRVLQHSGSNTMWYCSALLALDRQTAVLLASNCATKTAQDAIEDLKNRLMRAALPQT